MHYVDGVTPSRTLPMLPATPARAGAARRALIASAVMAAALGAHAVSVRGLSIIPIAPALWLMLIAGAALVGVRSRRVFRARGAVATLGLLLAWQAVVHLAITYAPWGFGLAIHHQGALAPGWSAVMAHLLVAVVLAAVIARAEVLMAAALRAARLLGGAARPARRRGTAPRLPIPVLPLSRPARGLRRAQPSRGPPVTA